MKKPPFSDAVQALIVVLCVFSIVALISKSCGDSNDLGVSVPTETRSKK
jgi:hypothetical protein